MHQDDEHYLKSLRIPLTDQKAEFEQQVSAIVKILNDSINVEALRGQIKEVKEDKPLPLLEQYLEENEVKNFEEGISLLRTIQSLRSSGVAHRKGEKYERVSKKLGLDEKSQREVFKNMLKEVTQFLMGIMEHTDSVTMPRKETVVPD